MTILALDEASGPVSPRFQYRLSIELDADGAVRIRSKHGPLGTHEYEGHVDPAALAALVDDARVLRDLVDDARAAKVGSRVNVLTVGDVRVRYMPIDVDERVEADDATRPLRVVRARILDLAKRALESVSAPS